MVRTLPSLLAVLGLLACSGTSDGTDPGGGTTGSDDGSTGDDGGEDGGDEGGDEGGTGDDGGDDDTGEVSWLELPNDCTVPTPDTEDVFTLTGSVKNTQDSGPGWFTEILDIAWLPEQDQVITTGQGGFVVFDVSDPTDPITKGHVGAGGGSFERYYQLLPIEPGMAWATHRESGLDAIDYSDPSFPIQLGRVEGIGYEGLDRHGSWVYVASTQGHVAIIDVTDPGYPTLHDTVEGLGRPWDVHVVGEVAYVADAELGLVALDLSDPSAPTVASTVESPGQPVRLDHDDDGHLFMVSGFSGLEIFDLSSPLEPALVSTMDPGGSAQDVAYDDGLVGVTTQEAVVLYDVGRSGSAEAPLPFSYEETEQFAMTLDASGGTWTVGDWNIMGMWSAGDSAAPATDLGTDVVAFLDEAETRTVELINRGGADLTVAGIGVPDGITVLISDASIAPGETALLEVSWDGLTELDKSSVCIATDDPDQGEVELFVINGADGEGKVIGQAAPDFELEDLDGNTHRLSEQLGKPVVLAYFATW